MAATTTSGSAQSGSGSEQKQNTPSADGGVEQGVQIVQDEQGKRRIGRWFIAETLGKGGYSWVKKGVDRKNGRIVALKFMARRLDKNGEWKRSQQSHIKNEIETLKCLRHNNIVRLLAYNLNATYPERNGNGRDVILLVLEYAAGGELFDILYYTEKLEPILARTYFRQLVDAISFMHSHGIVHRDIKPQNLLLDNNYNLKVTDFGLSKVDPTGAGTMKMTDWHVGTRGYQAPEILLRKEGYDKAVDIFAMGVVLFILLGGYPPFEHARENDKWYQFIVHKKYKNFWKSHRNCGMRRAETDLITRMLCFEPSKRISMEKIRNHAWYTNKQVLSQENIIKVLRLRHQRMEQQRNADPNKQKILQHSAARKPVMPKILAAITAAGKKESDVPPLLPKNEIIAPYDVYTASNMTAYEVLQGLETTVTEELKAVLCKPDYNELAKFAPGANEGDQDTANPNSNSSTDADDEHFDGTYIDVENFSLTFETAIQDLDSELNVDRVRVHVALFQVQVTTDAKLGTPVFNNLVKFTRLSGAREPFCKVVDILTTKAGTFLAGIDKNTAKKINETEKKMKTESADKQDTTDGAFDGFASFEEMYNACFPDLKTQ